MLDKTKPGLNHYELGRMSTLLVATVSSISCQNLIVNFMVFFCGGGEGGGGVKHNSVYVLHTKMLSKVYVNSNISGIAPFKRRYPNKHISTR